MSTTTTTTYDIFRKAGEDIDSDNVYLKVGVAAGTVVPLPTGAATSANQTTEITSLQILDDVPTAEGGTIVKGTPIMGQLDDTSTTPAVEDKASVIRITAQRAAHVNLRNNAGTEIATSGNPLRIDPTGTTSQPITAASGSIVAGAIAAGATSFVKLEDAASADADAGVPALAVRKATPANTSGSDGDYEFLQMSAGRLWASATIDAALPTGANTIGALTANQSVNVNQIAGNTTLTGNGGTGTGSQRVTIASDNTAFSVNATLSAETTKVIGTVRTADGSGNLFTSTAQALDVNIKSTTSTNNASSFSYQSALNATKVQIKGSAAVFNKIVAENANTSVIYIQVFNKLSASVTVGTTAPDDVIPLPAGNSSTDPAVAEISYPAVNLTTGFTVAATTTRTGSTNPTTSIPITFYYI